MVPWLHAGLGNTGADHGFWQIADTTRRYAVVAGSSPSTPRNPGVR
jgi:hypothetical protein